MALQQLDITGLNMSDSRANTPTSSSARVSNREAHRLEISGLHTRAAVMMVSTELAYVLSKTTGANILQNDESPWPNTSSNTDSELKIAVIPDYNSDLGEQSQVVAIFSAGIDKEVAQDSVEKVITSLEGNLLANGTTEIKLDWEKLKVFPRAKVITDWDLK